MGDRRDMAGFLQRSYSIYSRMAVYVYIHIEGKYPTSQTSVVDGLLMKRRLRMGVSMN